MNFVLTIDKQSLALKLEAILALFGKSRTMEFAEGKWTHLGGMKPEALQSDSSEDR